MTTSLDDDTLQRFYDGDLSPLEEHGVQARIEADPDAQRRLLELGRMTEVLRDGTAELGDSLDANALFAAIEGRLDKPGQVGVGSRLRVITSEWLEHRRSAVVSLAGAAAIAATTLLVVLRPGANAPESDGSLVLAPGEQAPATLPMPEEVAPAEPAAQKVAAVHGSSIEEVDFGGSTGTVFELDNEGVAVAVVWISDEGEP
jgi:anti-sigma factor RsiW